MTPHPAEPQQHDAVQSDLWRRVNAEAARDEWKRALSPWDGGSLVVRDDSLGRRLDGRSSVLMPRSPKLGSGPIAGIIVGCVVALGLLVCVLVPFILRLTRGRRSASPVVDTEANDPQTAPPAFGPRKDSERRLSQHDFVLPVTGLRKEDLPARQATKQSSFGQPEAGRDGTVAHAGPPVTGPTSAEAIYGGLIVASPVPAAASLPGPPSVPTMAGSQSPQKAAFSPTAQDGSGDVEMKDLAKASGAGSSAAVKAEAAAPGEAVSAGHLEAPSATGSDHGRPALNASYYDPTSSLYASAVDLSMSGPPPAPVELDQFKRKGISRVFSSSSRSPVKRSTGDSSGSNVRFS